MVQLIVGTVYVKRPVPVFVFTLSKHPLVNTLSAIADAPDTGAVANEAETQ